MKKYKFKTYFQGQGGFELEAKNQKEAFETLKYGGMGNDWIDSIDIIEVELVNDDFNVIKDVSKKVGL